ncbi:MAG: CotH kinase family protein [Treponema sp.]|jgi:spore coat protein CotH|nr:CotH kinase family protein [Treponema sp.]
MSVAGCGDSYSDAKGYVDPAALNTGLPQVIINTEHNQSITSKEYYIKAAVQISDPDNAAHNLTADDYNAEIRGRGNSTWVYPKKPYRLKFTSKQGLFGLEQAKSWVLLANFRDPTMLMNIIAFELGARFGFAYTNHYIPVDLVLNGVYEGTYVLTEQVQVGAGRVDIDEDQGFLVELDFHYDEEPKFKTSIIHLPVMIKSPEDLGPSGYDFVKDAINALEAALYAESFPESGYRDLIDLDNFVDYILINDLLMNTELQCPASVYMYRDAGAGAKIKLGPLWDFDSGFGFQEATARTFFTKYTGRIPFIVQFDGIEGQFFFRKFFEDPVFRARYKARWIEKYADIDSMIHFIDGMAEELYASQQQNYQVWQWSGGTDYNGEIAKMKLWWRNRVAYLDAEIRKY